MSACCNIHLIINTTRICFQKRKEGENVTEKSAKCA